MSVVFQLFITQRINIIFFRLFGIVVVALRSLISINIEVSTMLGSVFIVCRDLVKLATAGKERKPPCEFF